MESAPQIWHLTDLVHSLMTLKCRPCIRCGSTCTALATLALRFPRLMLRTDRGPQHKQASHGHLKEAA